jgi:anti-sigma B factor antagonist
MSARLSSREVGDVTVIDISGRISLADGSGLIRDTLRDLITRGIRKVLLNLAEVPHIDSSGIGELVSAFTSMASVGGKLKLVNLNKGVKEPLQITGLYKFFDVREDEADALRSFS